MVMVVVLLLGWGSWGLLGMLLLLLLPTVSVSVPHENHLLLQTAKLLLNLKMNLLVFHSHEINWPNSQYTSTGTALTLDH
jgi:hypothetical protein